MHTDILLLNEYIAATWVFGRVSECKEMAWLKLETRLVCNLQNRVQLSDDMKSDGLSCL